MDASHDRAAYFNTEPRAFWLGQVSEAATALAGTRVPKQLSESVGVSKISTEPSAAVTSISLSVRNDLAFNPADHLATHVRSRSKLATFTRLVIILAVAAITALIFTGQLPTDILTRDDIIEVASLPVISNLVTAITPERTSARLIVQSWRGNSDEPTPLGLAVQGPAEHAVVYIKGLMPGMELSSGSRVGSDAWEIPATGVGDVLIAPPQGFVGTAKLVAELRLPDSRIADRQAVYFEWELQRPTPVQHQLEERAALQSIPPEPIQPQTDRDEVVASQKPVIARGQFDGKEIAVASISPAPVQLQRNRGEAGPTESARLIVQSWRGNSDEPTPLGLAVQGPAEHAVVYIKGLMPGMELSSGSRVGSDAWEIPATGVGDVLIAPPQGFVGTAKLVAELRLPDSRIADRQAVYFEWELQRPTPVQHQLEERAALQSIPPEPIQPQTDRDEVVASQKPVIARGQFDGKEIAVASISPAPVQLQRNRGEAGPTEIPAATPRRLNRSEIGAMPAILLEPAQLKSDRDETAPADSSASFLQRQLDAQEIVLLLKRGKDLIAAGDIAAARIVLRKAAEANDAEAALGLAATYDPIVLRELKVYGFMPDAAMARVWYEKATELGSLAAPRRLEMLTKETGTR